jgi:PAS domain-containing protein
VSAFAERSGPCLHYDAAGDLASRGSPVHATTKWCRVFGQRTFIVAAVLGSFGILVAAIAALLVQRRALRVSVEQFRLRADQAPVLIWTARPDTSLDYLNGFCEQLTGVPSKSCERTAG